MRVDRETLLDLIAKLKYTEDSVRVYKEEMSRMSEFTKRLKTLYSGITDRSGYDKTISVVRKNNFKIHTDYEKLLAYRKKLKANRYYVAKKLAAMQSNKATKGET